MSHDVENEGGLVLCCGVFSTNLLGCDARVVMAEAEENKRKVKVVKVGNQ